MVFLGHGQLLVSLSRKMHQQNMPPQIVKAHSATVTLTL